MCIFHTYKYVGPQPAYTWVGGVMYGIRQEVMIDAKKCTKCGKLKVVR